jgi:spermidine/putrescine transport system substrate-binding protein
LKKRYILSLFAAVFTAISFLTIIFIKKSAKRTSISVYNWGEFISTEINGGIDVNLEFLRETGIEVNYSTFQSNEEMYASLVGGGADYDVIVPSDYMIAKMIENDMLAKLDFGNIPNYYFISENQKNLEFDPKNEYSVPYMWGILGIFYNKKYIKNKLSWELFWNLEYKGKILMLDDIHDSFCISFLKSGLFLGSTSESDWKTAAQELKKQKHLIQSYVTADQVFDKLFKEEAYIAPYCCGCIIPNDFFQDNTNITFAVPEGKTIKLIESMCIPKSSNKKSEAEKYINFMCRKEIALANSKSSGYISAQKQAESEILEKLELPGKEDFVKSKVYAWPNKILNLADELWVEIKSEDKNILANEIILAGMFVFFIFIYLWLFIKKFCCKNKK